MGIVARAVETGATPRSVAPAAPTAAPAAAARLAAPPPSPDAPLRRALSGGGGGERNAHGRAAERERAAEPEQEPLGGHTGATTAPSAVATSSGTQTEPWLPLLDEHVVAKPPLEIEFDASLWRAQGLVNDVRPQAAGDMSLPQAASLLQSSVFPLGLVQSTSQLMQKGTPRKAALDAPPVSATGTSTSHSDDSSCGNETHLKRIRFLGPEDGFHQGQHSRGEYSEAIAYDGCDSLDPSTWMELGTAAFRTLSNRATERLMDEGPDSPTNTRSSLAGGCGIPQNVRSNLSLRVAYLEDALSIAEEECGRLRAITEDVDGRCAVTDVDGARHTPSTAAPARSSIEDVATPVSVKAGAEPPMVDGSLRAGSSRSISASPERCYALTLTAPCSLQAPSSVPTVTVSRGRQGGSSALLMPAVCGLQGVSSAPLLSSPRTSFRMFPLGIATAPCSLQGASTVPVVAAPRSLQRLSAASVLVSPLQCSELAKFLAEAKYYADKLAFAIACARVASSATAPWLESSLGRAEQNVRQVNELLAHGGASSRVLSLVAPGACSPFPPPHAVYNHGDVTNASQTRSPPHLRQPHSPPMPRSPRSWECRSTKLSRSMASSAIVALTTTAQAQAQGVLASPQVHVETPLQRFISWPDPPLRQQLLPSRQSTAVLPPACASPRLAVRRTLSAEPLRMRVPLSPHAQMRQTLTSPHVSPLASVAWAARQVQMRRLDSHRDRVDNEEKVVLA